MRHGDAKNSELRISILKHEIYYSKYDGPSRKTHGTLENSRNATACFAEPLLKSAEVGEEFKKKEWAWSKHQKINNFFDQKISQYDCGISPKKFNS